MPRATRKSVAEEVSSPKSRSRTPAKSPKTATAAASASPSPRSRGGQIKTVENKRQSRSASQGKTPVTPVAQESKRQSRSGSKTTTSKEKKTPEPSGPKQKTTPTTTKRGHAKQSNEKEEEVPPKKAKVVEQKKGRSPAGRAASSQRTPQTPIRSAAVTRRTQSPAKATVSTRNKATPAKAATSTKTKTTLAKAATSTKTKTTPAKALTSTKTRASPAKTTKSAKSKATPAKATHPTKSKVSPVKAASKAKAKSPATTKSKMKSPASASARSSKSPRGAAVQNANRKKEESKKSTPRNRKVATPPSKGPKTPRSASAKAEPKKSTPKGTGYRKVSTSTPKSRSQRKQAAEKSREEEIVGENGIKEDLKDEEQKAEDVAGETTKIDDIEMKEDEQEDVEMNKKDETTKQDKPQDNVEEKKESEPTDVDNEPVADSSKADENGESVTEKPTIVETEANKDQLSTENKAKKTGTDPAQEDSAKLEDEVVSQNTTVSPSEPMEDDSLQDESVTGACGVEPENNNGKMEDMQILSPHSGIKRKLEEVDEVENGTVSKQARLNGAETEKDTASSELNDVEPPACEPEAPDSDLLKDFVVVNKEDVPAPDSTEVVQSVPADMKETEAAVEMEKAGPEEEAAVELEDVKEAEAAVASEKEAESSSVEPVFAVPHTDMEMTTSSGERLTQVEMIKACAYGDKNQSADRGDPDDASSIVVEVGSLAGSDILGGVSQILDVDELPSATNSTDGDHAAESGVHDPVLSEPAGCLDQAEAAPSTVSSADKDSALAQEESSLSPNPTNPELITIDSDSSSVEYVSSDNQSSVAQVLSSPEDQVQNSSVSQSTPAPIEVDSEPVTPLAKRPSIVTDSLGSPDPVFLAKFSSPGIFDRAYVPNTSVPADSVSPDNCFSIVSYNILAECNRLKADYSYTPREYLTQDYRHELLMKELEYLAGDVVCLQEVNPNYFQSTLLPAMNRLGYDGLMKRRTQEAFDEGEATFFKTGVFELVASKKVSLSEVALQEVLRGGLSVEVGEAINKYVDRADVVLITQLRSKVSQKVVTIGNIHVVWDFSRCPDVQCIQVACAIKEVVAMSDNDGAHMICGDFNSEWTTPAYQMAMDGYLTNASISVLQKVNNLDLDSGSKSLVNHLWKAFQHTSSSLRSAYCTVTKSEPEISTLTSFMESSVDYMMFSADRLVPVGVLKTVDKAVIKATGGLPSKDFPSDHVSMKSVMAFTK